MLGDRIIRILMLLFFFSVPFISGCVSVPGTGRSQLMLVTPAEERKLGVQEFEKMKAQIPHGKDQKNQELIRTVGKRIANIAPLPDAQWEFVLFDQSKVPNAFCLPGGKVGIYTGILPITKDDAGMATVMGHEVAHAVARHGAERLSRAMLMAFGGIVLDQLLQSKSEQTRDMVRAAYGVGGTVGVMLPYSRHNELEADKLGIMYMAKAGYDPRESIAFWKRFKKFKGSKGGPPEFLSTHPLDDRRIRQLEAFVPEAMRHYQKAKAG